MTLMEVDEEWSEADLTEEDGQPVSGKRKHEGPQDHSASAEDSSHEGEDLDDSLEEVQAPDGKRERA